MLFVPLLDRELRKISSFYETQEKELLDAVSDLEQLVKEQEESGYAAEASYFDEASDEEDEEEDGPSSAARSPEEPRPPKRQRRRSSAGPRYVGGASRLTVRSAINH